MTTKHQNDPFFDTIAAQAMDDFEESAQSYFDRLDPEDDIDIGADDEDIATLTAAILDLKTFDKEVRKLARFDDEYSYLKALDNY